jgi:hypothetical protein
VTRQHPELLTEPRCQVSEAQGAKLAGSGWWPPPASQLQPPATFRSGRVGIEQGSQLSNGNTPASSGCASRSLSGSGPVLVRIRELVSQRGFGAVLTDAICSLPKVATDLAPMWQLRT